MKKQWWYLLPVLLVGVVIGVLVGKSGNALSDTPTKVSTTPKEPSDEVVMSVEAVGFVPMPVLDTISANGVIAPKEIAEISPKLTGAVIEQVLVDVGDTIKAGQVLAVVDNSNLKDTVVQSQADLAQAEATLAKAKADLARVEPLLKIDAVSRQEVDAHRTTLRQAEASVVASQARLSTAQNSLNNSHIVSPVSGVISSKSAQVGTQVSGVPLFSVIVGGQLEWQATLDPSQATKIALGQPVKIMVGEEVVAGKVARLAPTANNAREIVVHVALPKGVPLKSGMYQTGEFILSQAVKPAVPVLALLSSDGYDYVLTLSPYKDGTYQVARTKVIAGQRQGEMVALDLPENTPLDGLMVRQSGSFLGDGDVVKVVNEIPTQDPAQPSEPPAQDTAVPASLARPQTQGQ